MKNDYDLVAIGEIAVDAFIRLKDAHVHCKIDTDTGEVYLEALKKDGVSAEFITIDKSKNTNYHYILWYGDERTILQKHTDFDYKLPPIGNPKWIYLTSLGEKSLPYHDEIIEHLKKYPDIKVAFQPGIFQLKMGAEKLREIYKRTEIFFCNLEEAEIILG